jgi:hypothetical protein
MSCAPDGRGLVLSASPASHDHHTDIHTALYTTIHHYFGLSNALQIHPAILVALRRLGLSSTATTEQPILGFSMACAHQLSYELSRTSLFIS